MSETLKVFDVKWTSITAGPSPDSNRRTEIFLWGCNIAALRQQHPKEVNQMILSGILLQVCFY